MLSDTKKKLQLYPNQFFSLADYVLPKKIKSLFKWCEYFFYKDPIIGSAITKMSAYPVTDFVYSLDSEDDLEIKKKWKKAIEDTLNLREILIQLGLGYFTFGNAFLSIYYGFERHLVCSKCNELTNISNNKNIESSWSFKAEKNSSMFHMKCPHCGHEGEAAVIDKKSNEIKDLNIVIWNPNQIDIKYYPITGKHRYFYTIPSDVIKSIKGGKDTYRYKTLPKEFLKAAVEGKVIELNSNETFFHFKRNTLTSSDEGWGKPMIIHSLQRLFYLYTLRRAQEAIAVDHIIPFDVFYPASQGGVNPHADIDLRGWQKRVQEELRQHRIDPNYKSVMPIPLGYQRIGGDGRALLLGAEIDQGNKEVCAGMGIPLEFVFGGLSWSGSSISLRLLENTILGYRQDLQRIINFVVEAVRKVSGLTKCSVKMTEIKMADDIQRLQLAMQLNSQHKLSDEDLMKELGWDIHTQWSKIKKESKINGQLVTEQMKSQATAQGEANIISSMYQAKAQIEGQKTINRATPELSKTMPIFQKQAQELNDLLQYLQLRLTYNQMLGQMPPEEGGGAPAPEGGGGAPAPEEGGGAPAPEEGGAMTPAEAEAGAEGAEPQGVSEAQYSNPFYQGPQGKGPDVEAMLKRWATKISRLPEEEKARNLQYIRDNLGHALYAKIMEYLATIPPGGTASDATNLMKPLPENRPPRRTGGGGIMPS